MKKLLPALAFTLALQTAAAHELWVAAPPAKAGETLKADLAYSHEYPHAEPIAKERLSIFKPLRLVSENGTADMKLYDSNFRYESAEPLKAGGYWVAAIYQPTFWSKNADGWKIQNRKEMTDASYCEKAQMFGKMYTATAGAKSELYTKPIGFPVEIIPLADPSTAKIGEPFPVQVLADGKPWAGAVVNATSDTFVVKDMDAERDHREPLAFSGKTDKEGKVNIIPLLDGFWKIKVEQITPYDDKAACDENVIKSSFTLLIGNGQLPEPETEEHQYKH